MKVKVTIEATAENADKNAADETIIKETAALHKRQLQLVMLLTKLLLNRLTNSGRAVESRIHIALSS